MDKNLLNVLRMLFSNPADGYYNFEAVLYTVHSNLVVSANDVKAALAELVAAGDIVVVQAEGETCWQGARPAVYLLIEEALNFVPEDGQTWRQALTDHAEREIGVVGVEGKIKIGVEGDYFVLTFIKA